MRSIAIMILLLAVPLAGGETKRHDVLVRGKTVVQRCAIKDTGSRMIAVGNPGGFNFVFDAQRAFVPYCWQGEFLDFSGEINGRGGYGCKILGAKQPLGSPQAPFRIGDPTGLPKELKFRGYRRDSASGTPTFLFDVDGVRVEQTVTSSGVDVVELKFSFPDEGEASRYFLIDPGTHQQIELGESLKWSEKGVVEIPGGARVARLTLHLKPSSEKFVRKSRKLSGEEVFATYCNACHSLDGSKLIGPSFKDFWGSERTVTRDGVEETVLADRDYVIESITQPQSAVVKGYEAVPMADFSALLGKDEIERVVDYLSGL